MMYFTVAILLFVLELLYFRLADRFNIIDKPNERSSHSNVTLRGGGIIFYFGSVTYFIWSGFQYPWFFLGLSLMVAISFLDDVFTLSNKIRLLFHFCSVLLMAYQLNIFSMPWYFLLAAFIVVVGVINAYNFMDGINGITACYSIAVGGLLLLINKKVHFVEDEFLIFPMLGVVVFAFFNFRITAKCFAGDVGSVAIAYILLFALGALIIKTGSLMYMLFLVVYGIDAVWTIVRRLLRGENIFAAHRSHLYQYLVNEAGFNKLWVSFLYAIIQIVIGYGVIWCSEKAINIQVTFAIILLTSLSGIYFILIGYLLRNYALHK
ncbi:MraY family glycosyltransferase [Sphingobacterium multivorum]|uniref:MraY family glycosyltransferase n=3 Tax=Sphingobacteriaceae TaxID=84566 RepID=UPI003DA395E9